MGGSSRLLLEQVVVELGGTRQVGVDAIGEHRQAVDVGREAAVAGNAPKTEEKRRKKIHTACILIKK